MRRHLLLIGGACGLLLCGGAAAADLPVLQRIRAMVEQEQGVTPEVAWFAAGILNATYNLGTAPGTQPVEAKDVVEAMRTGVTGTLCILKQLGTGCPTYDATMREIVRREMRTLSLGRKLQAIATSYEAPLSSFGSQSRSMLQAYADTMRVWGIPLTDSGALRTIRYLKAQELGNAVAAFAPVLRDLQQLSDEQRTAAVWRYRYGVAFVQKRSASTNPDGRSGPGTERQYLFLRLPELEKHLADAGNATLANALKILTKGEAAIGPVPLSPEITAWFSVRAPSAANAQPTWDVGLDWNTALEPVFPSLHGTDNMPIPGGRYPPPPAQRPDGSVLLPGGGGLCTTLLGMQGYLCANRTQRFVRNRECFGPPREQKDGTIILSSCLENPWAPAAADDDICKALRAGNPAPPCAPGKESVYPYTVIGHMCYIRECAERTSGHSIVPGREPVIAQESASPWGQCRMVPRDDDPVLVSPPSLLPAFPPYNPGARMHDAVVELCQQRAKPPQLPPVFCQVSALTPLETQQAVPANTAWLFVREGSKRPEESQLLLAEAEGYAEGADIYAEYLRKLSQSITGALDATVGALQRLASDVFPTTMCPLDPREDISFCPLPTDEPPSSGPPLYF